MPTESFHALALPYSVRPPETDDDFHVSLFIAPRLEPDGEEQLLEKFAVFPDWAAAVADSLEVRLEDQTGVIEGVEPLLHQVDPAIWRELFPPDRTPVRANRVPDWRERGWRSFDAGSVADIAKLVHLTTVATSLTELPEPGRHFLGRLSARRPLVIETGSDDDLEIERLGPSYWWDSNPTGEVDGLPDMVRQLHRARRFYERPEEIAQQPYRAKPDPNATSRPLPSPEPEFHARCAMAGDHPTLLRRLGLVVDLRVRDLDRLSAADHLVATVAVAGDPGLCRQQKVRCEAYDDGSFTTRSQHGDWRAGALALGEEDLFSVIDVDADGSALKIERYLGILPQTVAIERNDDPVSAATPALRAGGFTIARRHRAHYTEDRIPRQLDIEAGAGLDLHTEDVLRGMRVEVWDDTVGQWRSLHERASRIEVGAQTVAAADPGFVQGTAAAETTGVDDSKIHVHEALVGWEGWSLSVERPGKRIRHVHDGDPALGAADRREIVEETPAAPILSEAPPHPVRATHEVVKGSLPRLRFGRDYAFRAWAVDLAGNSRPHEMNPPVVPNLAPVLPQLPGVGSAPLAVQPGFTSAIRVLANEALEATRLEAATAGRPRALRDELRTTLTERVRASRVEGRPREGDPVRRAPSVGRSALLHRLAAETVADPDQPLVTDTTIRAPERLVDLIASHVGAIGGLEVQPSLADAAVAAIGTVTKLKPFLRWDPVLAPAVVPTKKYTEGESVRVVVIRSGVTQDADTLAVTVTEPAEYAANANAAVAGLAYADTSSRHLAPPKTSQVMAELHGRFDLGIGSQDAAKNQQMLTWALIEDGSLFDATRGSLDDPLTRVDQPGRTIVVQSDHSVVRDEDDLAPGDPLGPGQYVVHDTPELTLPYLPDPMAPGIALRFPEAGRHGIPAPEGDEGFTAAYRGTWPAVEPFRMDLLGSPVLGADVTGRVLSLRLPAGDTQRFRLSSSLPSDEATPSLDFQQVMGVWRSLPPKLTADPDVQEAARDGWIWGLTPSDDVTLVHAVPRPVEAPRPTKVWADRDAGSNSAHLVGVVDVHGGSTDSLIAEAAWTDPVDELDKPGPTTRSATAVAFQTKVAPEEDLLILEQSDGEAEWEYGSLTQHAAVHELGDTKHHRVTYTLRATTRFAEFFHPDLLAPAHPGDDGRSVVSAPLVVDVPSSSPPAAPLVHSVIPLFRWDDGTESEQPMAWRHERRAGVRIYLERPWFSSGDGELLGVLLAINGYDEFGGSVQDDSGFPFVSKIGADPVWHHRSVERRALSDLHLDSLLRSEGFDDRPAPGRPVVVTKGVPVRAGGASYDVAVAGYRPEYNEERGLWYVDVAIDPWASLEEPSPAFWPFVRLAVARFQPSSVSGCELSEPVRCDFVQLPPERTTSVSRTDERRVRVVVTGTRGWRTAHPERGFDLDRVVVAALQQRDPQIPSDLGWKTVDRRLLPVRSDLADWEVAWMGELDAGKPIPLRRPSPKSGGSATPTSSRWRVRVEEWERFEGDPDLEGRRTWESRLVFADDVLL